MNTKVLEERLEKSEKKVDTIRMSIERKKNLISKKEAEFQKKTGVIYTDDHRIIPKEFQSMGMNEEEAWDAYCLFCDVETLHEELENLKKKLTDTERIVNMYKSDLKEQTRKEETFRNDVPEILKHMEEQLIEEWDRWDKERKERLQKLYNEVGYQEFFHGKTKHTYAEYEFMMESMEKIHESNCKLARKEVMDLHNMVKDITGEVTDWSNIRCEQGNSFPVLTGIVYGKKGKASVQTILAGGYNIQRLHIRTLVHSL